MNEYCYEIDKYIVGIDSNGEDGIGLTIATMKDNKLYILGSCYGDNARFIDLLIKENQSLKDRIEKVEKWLIYKAEALDTFDIPKRKETGAFWFTTRGEIDGLLEILKGDKE